MRTREIIGSRRVVRRRVKSAQVCCALWLAVSLGVACGGGDAGEADASGNSGNHADATTNEDAGSGTDAASSSDATTTDGAATDAATDAPSAGDATSTTDGAADTSVDSGVDGGDAGGTMACGTATCTRVSVPGLGTLEPCCPIDETNACGANSTLSGNVCISRTPGTPDGTCPAMTTPIAAAGCCRTTHVCGVDLTSFGFGCDDPSTLGGSGGTPQPCGGDAGPSDAGGNPG